MGRAVLFDTRAAAKLPLGADILLALVPHTAIVSLLNKKEVIEEVVKDMSANKIVIDPCGLFHTLQVTRVPLDVTHKTRRQHEADNKIRSQ